MNVEDNSIPQEVVNRVMVNVPDDDALQNWFTYHKPTDEDIDKYLRIRSSALAFARAIMEECPNGPDKTVAIRAVRESVMWANASIACCGKK